MRVPHIRENAKWYVTLLGGVYATNGNNEDDRVRDFRTIKCASLFSYLVYKTPFQLEGKDLRGRIAYDIWEDIDLSERKIIRRLTTELNWLRDTFGSDVFPPNCRDIIGDLSVDGRLFSRAFSTDAGYWINTLVPAARRSCDVVLLRDTVINYGGQFAPSLAEAWAESERCRLEVEFTEILVNLANEMWRSGEPEQFTECLHLLEDARKKFRPGLDCHQRFSETFLQIHRRNNEKTVKPRAIAVILEIRASRNPLSDDLYNLVCELGAVNEADDCQSAFENM